ncbi:hypothetical protein PybrP1_000921, partial [[Pythium] brassicae (nom. inval.)]
MALWLPRDSMTVSTIRPDLLRLINHERLPRSSEFLQHNWYYTQWPLNCDWTATGEALIAASSLIALEGWKVTTYELHDFRFARYGYYPKRHTMLLLEQGTVRAWRWDCCRLTLLHVAQLQVVYMIEKEIDNDVEKLIGRTLVECLDPQALQQLARSASVLLGGYLELTRSSRLRISESTLEGDSALKHEAGFPAAREPHRPRFLQYVVVVDLLRGALLGESLRDIWRERNELQDGSLAASTAAKDAYAAIFTLFLDRIAGFQSVSPRDDMLTAGASSTGDPDLPTWVAPVKLDTDDPNTLFLHEPSSEFGADISSEDSHVFPPPGETLFIPPVSESNAGFATRLVHQDAEALVVTFRDGSCQRLWVIANYYETVHSFAIFDADLVSVEAVEQEVDRICAFGGFDRCRTATSGGRYSNKVYSYDFMKSTYGRRLRSQRCCHSR